MTGVLNFPGDLAGLTSGSVNWPDPQTGTDGSIAARLDDLWHAGVNGGGTYASASDPEDVVDALRSALATIADQEQTGASAATSSLEPIAGDNFAYVAKYTTASWTGELEGRTIDLTNGTISNTAIWSAQDQLDTLVTATTDTRNIYTWNTAGNARVPFTLANVNAANFSSTSLSQWSTWNATQKTNASADALIKFLRGQHDFEMRNDDTHTDLNKRLYRKRTHVMGDIVNSSPVYVKKPPFRYSDAGYAAFVGANVSRAGTVYAGANDGMLHAYNADTGAERWAYVPRMLHGEMYKLADASYASNHRYYVDGVITVGDVYDGSAWHTVLVAGLGGGGKGYFALDITDPGNPSVLWEYTNSNLGNTYGNPVITKRANDGTWVVLFASGYNNTAGDSQGRLFMLDALTGSLINSVATGGGTDPDLSGIAKITNWVLDTLVDNSTQYVYGGDLAGNLWRFDINSMAVQKLGQTSGTPGALPITSRPEVGRLRDSAGTYHRVIYIGTGRYLGANDVSGGSTPESTVQMMLAVKDTGTNLGTLTASLVQQTLDVSGTPRTIPTPQPVNWASQDGWYVTIPMGERVTIDPRLQLGTIAFVANKPVDDYCALGGSSWLYTLDFRSGGPVTSQASNAVGTVISSSTIATGFAIFRTENGNLYGGINTTGGVVTKEINKDPAGGGAVRRVGYREIN
jgi:type IV pilus assembly protein PilY1